MSTADGQADRVILVTGATGNVGRHVVAELVGMGMPLRALSRRGVGPHAIRGDLTDPGSLDDALSGVHTLLLVVLPGEPVAAVLDRAREHGAHRVVLLSSGAVADAAAQANPVAELHAAAERAVERSGLEYVVLRPRWLASNALWWAPTLRAGRPVRTAYPDAVTAPVHEHDVAAVAVRALRDAALFGRRLMLTGPDVLTQTEQIALICRATGAPAAVERIGRDIARAEMQAHMPTAVVDTMLDQQARLRRADIRRTGVVAEVTGRPARSFAGWAREHRAVFINC